MFASCGYRDQSIEGKQTQTGSPWGPEMDRSLDDSSGWYGSAMLSPNVAWQLGMVEFSRQETVTKWTSSWKETSEYRKRSSGSLDACERAVTIVHCVPSMKWCAQGKKYLVGQGYATYLLGKGGRASAGLTCYCATAASPAAGNFRNLHGPSSMAATGLGHL